MPQYHLKTKSEGLYITATLQRAENFYFVRTFIDKQSDLKPRDKNNADAERKTPPLYLRNKAFCRLLSIFKPC